MSLKQYAKVFGIVFIIIGILGFIYPITKNDMLFGIFHVNKLHNFFHIATGLIAYIVGRTGNHPSKLFFQIFGIIYGVLAVLGFGHGNQDLLGCIANNMADAWLHFFIAIAALYLGFLFKLKD